MDVLWHDIECGDYDEDLVLWEAVAAEAAGPVLDVGAGTGRVALHLAARGANVVATDLEPALLAALADRARRRGLAVETVAADARDLAPLAGRDFAAVIVPMQTIQLLEGAADRARFYAGARAALRPGGLLAAALADAMEAYDERDEDIVPPVPDMREIDGVVYASRPIAVRDEPEGAVIVRVREVVHPDGTHRSEGNEIRLERLDTDTVAAEAAGHGFARLPDREVSPTVDYVGSQVVVLRAV